MALRDEPSINDLIAARERTDAGNRLAFPALFDGLGSDPSPPPSVEGLVDLLTRFKDAQTTNYRRQVADAALESIEELKAANV